MDRQVENVEAKNGREQPGRSDHLMCRTPLWGAAGFLSCTYFAWLSFTRVTHSEYEWPHDLWTAATYIIWILLLAAMALDTRCLRERIFFGLLVLNFVVGCALTLWHNAPSASVRAARIGTGILWALAALASLTTLQGTSDSRGNRV
jgi:hypothetical protein